MIVVCVCLTGRSLSHAWSCWLGVVASVSILGVVAGALAVIVVAGGAVFVVIILVVVVFCIAPTEAGRSVTGRIGRRCTIQTNMAVQYKSAVICS